MSKQFPYVYGYKASWRDRAVANLSSWIITTFATTAYQNFVTDLMLLGRTEFEKRLAEEVSDD